MCCVRDMLLNAVYLYACLFCTASYDHGQELPPANSLAVLFVSSLDK